MIGHKIKTALKMMHMIMILVRSVLCLAASKPSMVYAKETCASFMISFQKNRNSKACKFHEIVVADDLRILYLRVFSALSSFSLLQNGVLGSSLFEKKFALKHAYSRFC